MIKINFTKNHLPPELLTAIKEVQDILDMLSHNIDNLPIITFDPLYTKPINLTSVDILQLALEQDIEITIATYTQNWWAYRMTPVNAYVIPSEPNVIHFNTRMFKGWGKTAHDYKETLWHEKIHLFDKYSPYSFGHGTNSLNGKQETAPVKLARLLSGLKKEDLRRENLLC